MITPSMLVEAFDGDEEKVIEHASQIVRSFLLVNYTIDDLVRTVVTDGWPEMDLDIATRWIAADIHDKVQPQESITDEELISQYVTLLI